MLVGKTTKLLLSLETLIACSTSFVTFIGIWVSYLLSKLFYSSDLRNLANLFFSLSSGFSRSFLICECATWISWVDMDIPIYHYLTERKRKQVCQEFYALKVFSDAEDRLCKIFWGKQVSLLRDESAAIQSCSSQRGKLNTVLALCIVVSATNSYCKTHYQLFLVENQKCWECRLVCG